MTALKSILVRAGVLVFLGASLGNALAQQDFGDAPAPYPTLLRDDGARHTAIRSQLGFLRDTEADGQPHPNALGDNLNGLNDEDGIIFVSAVVPGQIATIQVIVTNAPGSAKLDAWVDFDFNGSWAETADHIFNARVVTNGVNTLTFLVPAATKIGSTFARFRLSEAGGLNFTGAAPDGEVEDYQVTISEAMDFGDAPKPYPTLLADDGARHRVIANFSLGTRIDSEPDGQPNATATGDDAPGPLGPGDEDGITFTTPLTAGQTATVQVVCTMSALQNGRLNAWIDFNGNGNWNDPGEQIFTNYVVRNGTTNLSFAVPLSAAGGTTFARFRLNGTGNLSPTGYASDGEVEDYKVVVAADRDRCDLDCHGREFWLTFPGNYTPDPTNPPVLSLVLNGVSGTAVSISVPGIGFITNVSIPPSLSLTVPLPRAAELGDLIDGITNRGIHVVASAPIGITAFNHARFTTDSYLALHTSVLGTSYIVMGFGNLHAGVPSLNGTQFAIVGTESNTVVLITPSVTTAGRSAGLAYAITLQPGDTYQLRNTNDAPADLSGTMVKSDKPIAVFGGHQGTSVPSSDVWFANHLVEQLLPVNTWGSDFYVAPLATQTAGYTVRLLAAYDATVISLNGVPLAILNRGQFVQSQQTNGAHFTSTQPILVTQYAASGDLDGNAFSDPFMLTVQGVRHFGSSYRISTPDIDFPTNYVNIIAPTAALGTLQLDGAAVVSPFTRFGTTDYYYARILITPGTHLLASSGGIAFGASAYGWSDYDGYGHPGCFYFGDVSAPKVTSPTNNVRLSVADYAGSPGLVPTPNLTNGTVVTDNCTQTSITPTQSPKGGTLVGPGVYTLTLSALDISGNIGEVNVPFTVIDPSPVVIDCLPSFFASCTGSNGAIVNFTVRAHTTYETNVSVVSSPPSGSLFPLGSTVVTSVATSLAGLTNTCSFTVTVSCDPLPPPKITVVRGAGGTVLSFPGTAVLEFSSNLNSKWFFLTNGVDTYRIPLTGKEGYFRLHN